MRRHSRGAIRGWSGARLAAPLASLPAILAGVGILASPAFFTSPALGQMPSGVADVGAPAYGDSLLAARVDSLGLEAVLNEARGTLVTASVKLADPAAGVSYDESEAWLDAMRWAALLGDEASLPMLDAVAGAPWREAMSALLPRLTHFARLATYDIRTRAKSPAEKATALLPQLLSPDTAARDFAADQLLRLGSPALAPLLEYVRAEILPRVAAAPAEPFSEEDLQPQRDYLFASDLVRSMISTDKDRALVEALLRSDDPQLRAFAEEVLGRRR